MRHRFAFISLIFICILLLNPINTTIGNNNYSISSNPNYFLDHNLTINRNHAYYISNENLNIFTHNISIFDYGKLCITDTNIEHSNFSLNIFVNNGQLTIINSTINVNGGINGSNSSLSFIGTQIGANSNVSFNFNQDSIIFKNSNIRFDSSPIKTSFFTAAKLYGTDLPSDTPGSLKFKESDFNSHAFVGNLSMHLYIQGDRNVTGNIELFEFGKFVKNLSIPVMEGNHYYNKSVQLPKDLKSYQLNNTSMLALEIPGSSQGVSGEDGYLSFSNITILARSNDTENYYGLSNYNMIISNSNITSCNSIFHTNMKKFYIYQHILNPDKKSIFLINSTFYSYSSIYTGTIYKNPPFYAVNSSVYYYEKPKFIFSNGMDNFTLKYNIMPNDYNKSINLKARSINEINTDKNMNNSLIVEVQNNNSISYFGDYKLAAGRFIYNFSFRPLPDFVNLTIFKIHVNIPKIESSIDVPKILNINKKNMLDLKIKSIGYASIVNVSVSYSGSFLFNQAILIASNNSVEIPLFINSSLNGILYYKINYSNNYYNVKEKINDSIPINFSDIHKPPKRYILTVESQVKSWHARIDGKNLSASQNIINVSLVRGNYKLSIYAPGYKEKTYNVNLTSNMTLYATLQQIHHSSYLNQKFYFLAIIGIIGAISSVIIYSKRSITCKKCGTKFYASFDKCPVCLTPNTHKFLKRGLKKL